MKDILFVTRILTICSIAVLASACNTAPAGGGGGGGGGDTTDDPLAEFQLGEDEELDQNVGAITTADNASVQCFGGPTTFTDEEVFDALKVGYNSTQGIESTFPEFVADVAAIEQSKQEQICETNLGDDQTLDAAIERTVGAANQLAECNDNPADATAEEVLPVIKALFFERGISATDLVAFAEAQADSEEQQANDACNM